MPKKKTQKNSFTRILVLVVGKHGVAYLKTIDECGETTIENAKRAGLTIVSRKSKGITEVLTEHGYESEARARQAVNVRFGERVGVMSYQKLASLAWIRRENL